MIKVLSGLLKDAREDFLKESEEADLTQMSLDELDKLRFRLMSTYSFSSKEGMGLRAFKLCNEIHSLIVAKKRVASSKKDKKDKEDMKRLQTLWGYVRNKDPMNRDQRRELGVLLVKFDGRFGCEHL